MKGAAVLAQYVDLWIVRLSVFQMARRSAATEAPAPAASSASGPEAEWAKRLSSVTVSKATMDRLVMNWLVIEGYQEAAQRFMAESGTDGAPASTQHR